MEGFLVWSPCERRVIVSRDVVFCEVSMTQEKFKEASTEELEESKNKWSSL